jgi:hypothetical protein
MSKADPEPASPELEDSGVAVDPAPRPTQMDRREQLLGWTLAGVVAVAVAISWAPDAVRGNGKAVSGAIALGMTAVLAAAVRYGRRIFAAFASMAMATVVTTPPASSSAVKTGVGTLSLLGLLFGGFLLFRNTVAQRKVAMARPRRPRRPPRAARARTARGGEAGASAAAEAARRPSANRRYTPPKAKTPRRGR